MVVTHGYWLLNYTSILNYVKIVFQTVTVIVTHSSCNSLEITLELPGSLCWTLTMIIRYLVFFVHVYLSQRWCQNRSNHG